MFIQSRQTSLTLLRYRRLFVHVYRLFDSYSIKREHPLLLTGSFFGTNNNTAAARMPLTQCSLAETRGGIVASIINSCASDKSVGYLRYVDHYLQNVLASHPTVCLSRP